MLRREQFIERAIRRAKTKNMCECSNSLHTHPDGTPFCTRKLNGKGKPYPKKTPSIEC